MGYTNGIRIFVTQFFWMRTACILAIFFAQCFQLCAQVTDNEYPCATKYAHRLQQNVSNQQQVAYYQYPSMNKYNVSYLKLDISAETNSRIIAGSALTLAKAVAPMDSFITELRSNMTVDSIFINGVKKTFSRASDHIFVPLSPAIPAGNNISALVYYRGTANSTGVFAGISNGLSYTATLSESYQAREWFPVKQQLQDKFDSVEIWVTTSNINKVGSNGLLQGVDALPNNKSRYRWKSINKMNYYMPSISVGNYMEYLNYAKPAAMAPDSILIQHYIYDNATYFNSNKANLDKTPAFIEKFSELYGLYPFKNEKYGHAQASIGGGMEHQTMSTMVSFGSTLIAHELGHQWWGDHVTCAKWNDIWLNEGFATYSEQLLIEKLPSLFTTTAAANMLSLHSSVMSVANGSVYLPDASVYDENRIFSSRLSYNKGGAIIHTLRFEMQSDTLFFKTLRNFQTQFKDSVATGEDFKTVAQNTSGKNLNDFFTQWYYGEGYPTYNITYYKPTTDSIYLVVNETVSAPTVTPFFKGLLELTIQSAQGDTTILVNVAYNNQGFKLKCAKNPTGIIVDPNNWIINKTGTITNGVVVPVVLKSFTGVANDNCQFALQWKVEQESFIEQYDIQSSTDGKNFTTIATSNALGWNANMYNYLYTGTPASKIYFRLKMIHKDHSFSYSSVLALLSPCAGHFNVNLSPVPVQQMLHIKIEEPTNTPATIQLLNGNGQILYQEKVNLSTGSQTIVWSKMDRYPAGNYIIRIQNEDGSSLSKKFIKK